MFNLKNPASLEEKTLIKVVIDRCQVNDFKETVLCLEKPVYGAFIPCSICGNIEFISDPEKLAEWAAMMKDKPEHDPHFICSCHNNDENRLELWDRLLEEQCQKLTGELPITLRLGAQSWMNRMALDYLSYCRRQETLFGLSRYFMMDFVTREDWNDLGGLDEERLTERLVKDERLTVLQRYRIACVYCLRVDSQDNAIADLWKQLTPEEKASLSGKDDPYLSSEKNRLVLLWSYFMDRRSVRKVTGRKNLHRYAIEKAVEDGNRVALKSCWRLLEKNQRQDMAMKMASKTFNLWFVTQPGDDFWQRFTPHWGENLMSVELFSDRSANKYNLPFYYSDLLCFFLSEMDEPNQLIFYKKAFQEETDSHVLECFLNWPLQDYFIPTIRKLWDILPQLNYGQCLLTIASKYSGKYDRPLTAFYTKEDCYYDYQSLLFELWKETPEDYKRYVFTDKFISSPYFHQGKLNVGQLLLPKLISKYPFTERVKGLFNIFFNDMPKEERIILMSCESGKDIYSTLLHRGDWSFFDWVLKKFLPVKETTLFKKQFIESYRGEEICFDILKKNLEKKVEDIINWSFESTEEKKEFKKKLIYSNWSVSVLCREMNFSEIERIMDFCLPSEEMKKEFKTSFTERACSILLESLDLDKADRILAWGFDSDEEIDMALFKIDMFFDLPIIDIHYDFILENQWENVKRFYKWFNLSDEEIKNLKEETVFDARFFEDMAELLFREDISPDLSTYLSYLRWCLTNEQIIIEFKETFEMIFSRELDHDKRTKEHLDHLIEVLFGFKNDTQNKTGSSEDMKEKQIVLLKCCDIEEQNHSSVEVRGTKREHEVTKEESKSSCKQMAKSTSTNA